MSVVTGSQMSKTEALINLALSRLHDGPRAPVMLVEPSRKLATSVAERLEVAIRQVPRLAELREGGRRNRVLEKFVAGVRLGIAWAGSKIELASHPVGLALVDEIDRMDSDVEGEGDPVTLVSARLKNYRRALLFLTSTPTVLGASACRVWWEEGTREAWQWACPHCAVWFLPLPEHVRWPEGADPATAAAVGGLHCPTCQTLITDAHQQACIAGGRMWPYDVQDDGTVSPAATPAPEDAPARSYWITGCSSVWQPLSHLTQRLCAAYRSQAPERIQAELNTYWGTWWVTSGERPRWEDVKQRTGQHARGTPPDWTLGLVMGVDVQRDRLEWLVMAIGTDFRKAIVDWGTLWGDPEGDECWQALAAWRLKRYGRWQVQRVLVDSGYQPGYDHFRRPQHVVYDFARRHVGWAFAAKGVSNAPQSVRPSSTHRDGVLWLVSADYVKSMVYADLRGDEHRLTVPRDVTDDLCQQLTAEELIRLPSGRLKWVVQGRRPNHYLDCAGLCIAAAITLNLHTYTAHPEPTAPQPTRVRMAPHLLRR